MTDGGQHSSLPSKRFTARNEPFRCRACDADIPVAKRSYRNHCNTCLASLHVDIFPGDRKETCHGIMDAVSATLRHGEWIIEHVCRTCGAHARNHAATDDAWERLIELSQKPTRF